jgi:hypothetical protein
MAEELNQLTGPIGLDPSQNEITAYKLDFWRNR